MIARRNMTAQNIRFLRRYFNDKQIDLARILGVTQSTISDYERGNKPLTVDKLHDVSHRYGVSIDDMVSTNLSIRYEEYKKIEIKSIKKFMESVFPIMKLEGKKTSKNFDLAYKILVDTLNADSLEKFYTKTSMLEHAIHLFKKDWDDRNCFESLSNFILTTLIIHSFYSRKCFDVANQLTNKRSLSYLDIQKAGLKVRCCSERPQPFDKKKRDYLKNMTDYYIVA